MFGGQTLAKHLSLITRCAAGCCTVSELQLKVGGKCGSPDNLAPLCVYVNTYVIWFVMKLVGSWRGGLRSPLLAHVPIWENGHVIGIMPRWSTTCWPGPCCSFCSVGVMQSTCQQHIQVSLLRPVPITQPFRPLSRCVRRSRRGYRCSPSALAVQDIVDSIQSSPVISGAVATTGQTVV